MRTSLPRLFPYGVLMRHGEDAWDEVESLKAEGLSDPEIARRTGIPRSTVYMHFVRQRITPSGPSETESLGGGLGLLVALGLCALIFFVGRRRLAPPSGPTPLPDNRALLRPGSSRQDPHQSLWWPTSDPPHPPQEDGPAR